MFKVVLAEIILELDGILIVIDRSGIFRSCVRLGVF
jgi:hypothetical protein